MHRGLVLLAVAVIGLGAGCSISSKPFQSDDPRFSIELPGAQQVLQAKQLPVEQGLISGSEVCSSLSPADSGGVRGLWQEAVIWAHGAPRIFCVSWATTQGAGECSSQMEAVRTFFVTQGQGRVLEEGPLQRERCARLFIFEAKSLGSGVVGAARVFREPTTLFVLTVLGDSQASIRSSTAEQFFASFRRLGPVGA